MAVAATPLLGQGADAAYGATVASHLQPLLGRAAPIFFGIGLFAAGLTPAITAPLAAAYAARGALAWRSDLKSGRIHLPWGFVPLTGMSFGIFLPFALILLFVMVNKIVGKYRNSTLANVLGAFVVLVISELSLVRLARVLGISG